MALSGFVLAFAFQSYQFTYFRTWVIWRGIRLLPMYYLPIFGAGIISSILLEKTLITIPQLNHTYLFQNSTIYSGPNPPLWSLSVEIILSILFFQLSFLSKLIEKQYWVYFAIYALTYLIDGWGIRALIRSAVFFSIGISMYLELNPTRLQKQILASGTCIFLVFGLMEFSFSHQIVTAFQIFAIPYILWLFTRVTRSNIVFLYCGKISFSLYVWHWPVLIVMRELLIVTTFTFPFNKLITAIFAVISTVIIASVSYYFLESPVHRLARKFLSRIQ